MNEDRDPLPYKTVGRTLARVDSCARVLRAVALFAPLLFALPTFSPPAYADFNPMVRIDPRVDRFTQRVNARYNLLPQGYFRQPMGTADYAAFLDSLSSFPLTPQERYTLEGLRKQLSINKGLYGFRDESEKYGLIVNLDWTGDIRARFAGDLNDRLNLVGAIAPMMRGYVGKLSFYSSFDVWTEYDSDTLFYDSSFQPYDGIPYTVFGREERRSGANVRASDMPRAGINYDAGRITMQAALDYLRLGPAAHYPVTLSGLAPPITYARLMIDLTHVEYFHVVGLLRSQKDKPKYIYSNGLRGALWGRRLHWGISQVTVAGSTTNQQDDDPINAMRPEYMGQEQGWEWAYFVPFMPMALAEDYTGDRANTSIGFDFSLTWPREFRFYGELFMDDLLDPWSFFSDDWGNKWAITLGAQYFTSARGRDIDAGIEWSMVRPWVYTHFYGGSHRYDHFNVPLGSPSGPNSMSIYAHCGIGVTKKITAGLQLTSLSNNPSARGGQITHIFQDPGRGQFDDSETVKFWGDGTVHHVRPGIYGHYDPFGLFRVNAAVEIDASRDRGRVHFTIDGGFRF